MANNGSGSNERRISFSVIRCSGSPLFSPALSGLWTLIGAPISLITQIAIYTLYGAGVNLLVGYTGLVPFGASVFFGCASYAVAVFMLGGVGNEFAALLFAVVFSILLALAIGALILRRKGLYFSLLTLAFSQIAFEIAYKWTAVTGGENGLQGVAADDFPVRLVVPRFRRRDGDCSRCGCCGESRIRRSAACCRRSATTNCAPAASATTSI